MKKEKRTRSAKRDPAFIAIQRWHRNWEKFCRFLDSQGVKVNKKRKAALDRQVRAAYSVASNLSLSSSILSASADRDLQGRSNPALMAEALRSNNSPN